MYLECFPDDVYVKLDPESGGYLYKRGDNGEIQIAGIEETIPPSNGGPVHNQTKLPNNAGLRARLKVPIVPRVEWGYNPNAVTEYKPKSPQKGNEAMSL